MTDETPNVLHFPAVRAAGRLLPAERSVLTAFAVAQDAEMEFADVGDEGNDKPGAACDRACLDFGDRLIWRVMRPAGETNIVVLCGEMIAGRYLGLAEALDMLGREPWRCRAMRQRNAEREARWAAESTGTTETDPPNSAA